MMRRLRKGSAKIYCLLSQRTLVTVAVQLYQGISEGFIATEPTALVNSKEML